MEERKTLVAVELFVYWRVARGERPLAAAAMAEFQRGLTSALPGLRARLLQRADEAGAQLTLMETYALPSHPEGVGEALQRQLVERGDAVSAPWRQGPRHVEAFVGAGVDDPQDQDTPASA